MRVGQIDEGGKGVVKGMMIAVRTLGLFTVEELTEIINQERKIIFG